MSVEAPRQKNMFTDTWEDNRNRRQKRLDKQRTLPMQRDMFSQGRLIQFGVRRPSWLNDLPRYKLELEREDPRAPEEIAQDLMREAEDNTEPMFGERRDKTT